MKKFNINDNVYFKCTKNGFDVWRKTFERYASKDYLFEEHLRSYTKGDYNFMQMHCFMEIFGESPECLKETSIFFNESDLK